MKNRSVIFSQLTFTVLLLTLCTSAFSQKTITWKGGTPGRANDWNCAKNWSTNTVPNEYSDVIIPDVSTTTFQPPVIRSGKVEVNSLLLQSNANLTIEPSAAMLVYGNAEGINDRTILGKDRLQILNFAVEQPSGTTAAVTKDK